MRKTNYFQYLAMMMLIVASLCATLTSCENKEDEPNLDIPVKTTQPFRS